MGHARATRTSLRFKPTQWCAACQRCAGFFGMARQSPPKKIFPRLSQRYKLISAKMPTNSRAFAPAAKLSPTKFKNTATAVVIVGRFADPADTVVSRSTSDTGVVRNWTTNDAYSSHPGGTSKLSCTPSGNPRRHSEFQVAPQVDIADYDDGAEPLYGQPVAYNHENSVPQDFEAEPMYGAVLLSCLRARRMDASVQPLLTRVHKAYHSRRGSSRPNVLAHISTVRCRRSPPTPPHPPTHDAYSWRWLHH